MFSRVVITGIGVVSPAGIGVEALRSALVTGKSCVRRIDTFETTDLPCKIGAPVPDFNVQEFLNVREAKRLDRSAQLFVVASFLALEDSNVFESGVDRSRIGIYEGTSLGGLQSALDEQEVLLRQGYAHVNPMTITGAMTGVGGSMVSLLHKIRGPVFAYSNGSTSSAYALKGALDQLRLGEIDAAIVGGAEAPISRPIFALFGRARVLSGWNDTPETACRPFDATRDGVVLGEAGAVLILERLNRTRRRGAKIYGEVLAVGLTSDAHSLVAPAPDGSQQARAIVVALEGARISPSEVDYISVHGTSTPLNDRLETLALKKALGERAYRIPVSSSKSMFGHALGASTAIELVKTVVSMECQFVPPTINLTIPDPECDLDYVANCARSARVVRALVNNASFGGKNSSILLQRWSE